MSAFLVDRLHVDLLVALAIRGPSDRGPRYPGDGWSAILAGCEDATDLGRSLWSENVKSIAYRYQNDNLATETAEARWYTYREPAYHLTVAEGLKALRCLAYQSCEHPDWPSSTAFGWARQMQNALSSCVAGYDDAPWEWNAERLKQAQGKGETMHARLAARLAAD